MLILMFPALPLKQVSSSGVILVIESRQVAARHTVFWGRDLLRHSNAVFDGLQESPSLSPESGAQTLRATDQQTDNQVGILFHTLTCKTVIVNTINKLLFQYMYTATYNTNIYKQDWIAYYTLTYTSMKKLSFIQTWYNGLSCIQTHINEIVEKFPEFWINSQESSSHSKQDNLPLTQTQKRRKSRNLSPSTGSQPMSG